MAVVPIRIVGDPVLHNPTKLVPVAADGSLPTDLADLIATLYDTMAAANGVGLAANQIGAGLRVFVYDCADERGQSARRRGVVVNPVLETSEIPETMPDPDNDDEGCLSVPGETFPTGRAKWARVTGLDANGSPITDCPGTELAPSGTQLPGTSKVKGNLVARYAFPVSGFEAYSQAAFVYQSAEWDDLRIVQREEIGQQPAFGTLDLSFGLARQSYAFDLFLTNAFDKRGELFRFNQCASCSIVGNYATPTQPRTIALKFSQKF